MDCARCGMGIKVKKYSVSRMGRRYTVTKILNGYTITNRLGQMQLPLCRKCYGVAVDVLSGRKEAIYHSRNSKGQFQVIPSSS